MSLIGRTIASSSNSVRSSSTALLELVGPVRRAEPAPEHEVRARSDRRGRIDLQHRQLLHDREQIGRARRIEELRPHSDPPRLFLGQLVHGFG